MTRAIKFGLAAAAAAALAVSALAAAKVKSGLEPGTTPGAFQVVDVTGPNKGKQLCYRCQYGVQPVMAAFINGDAVKSEALVADLQKIVDAHKKQGLKSFVVYMSGPGAKDAILKVAADKKTTIPLVFLPKGTKEGDIAAYKISDGVKNTVLLWRGQSVKGNFVDVEAKSLGQVEQAVDAMLK